jgi:hypothetical protein
MNASVPILVTEAGIIIDVNPVQLRNTDSPILVSVEVGVNVTDVNEVQLSNA